MPGNRRGYSPLKKHPTQPGSASPSGKKKGKRSKCWTKGKKEPVRGKEMLIRSGGRKRGMLMNTRNERIEQNAFAREEERQLEEMGGRKLR